MNVDHLNLEESEGSSRMSIEAFKRYIEGFALFGQSTSVTRYACDQSIPVYTNEFWTAKQRAASSLHEVSYLACFKPQLPRFFISKLSREGDLVYDPFMGRGTTLLEAAFMKRIPLGCDVNPLSHVLLLPRLDPPSPNLVYERIRHVVSMMDESEQVSELLTFYHQETLKELSHVRGYFLKKESEGELDTVDQWVRMVMTNRLTGHSEGFLSVYTLPPNKAVSLESQKRINMERKQVPPYRNTCLIVEKKTRRLLNRVTNCEVMSLRKVAPQSLLLTRSADVTPEIKNDSVSLVVTSPPFLNVINYEKDNWLRCWFNGIDPTKIGIWQFDKEKEWGAAMRKVFVELYRILRHGGCVAFEVGEIKKGQLLMEELVIPSAQEVGFKVELILINAQHFTKTANCWGVSNARRGTNTNRIILLSKR